jgi:hypothetical protein
MQCHDAFEFVRAFHTVRRLPLRKCVAGQIMGVRQVIDTG